MNLEDTIVALSSPPGRTRRAIIRMSGPSALALAHLEDVERGCSNIRLALDGWELPTIAIVARGPASYTGEDVVELLVPGGPAIVERVQEQLEENARACGANLRNAGPGEFTARAYLHGRIGLLEAEGIAEAIRAESDAHLHAANLMSEGGLRRLALELSTELTRFTALVEAGIDFTDQEDVVAISNEKLHAGLTTAIEGLRVRLDRSVPIEALESVPFVVLAGAANAGKSSLFNALLGTERMVVNVQEGTTRDVVVESMRLPSSDGELEIFLADVAGFEAVGAGAGSIEESMQRRANQAVDRADLVIRCTPGGDRRIDLPEHCTVVDVVTKADLCKDSSGALATSALERTGIDELLEEIVHALGGRSNTLSEGVLALSRRHEETLRRVLASIEMADDLLAQDGVEMIPPAELIASTLRSALDGLGELVGRVTPDEVLEHVFARFCVGK